MMSWKISTLAQITPLLSKTKKNKKITRIGKRITKNLLISLLSRNSRAKIKRKARKKMFKDKTLKMC